MATFTWTPDYETTGKTKPNVLTVGFGDGYKQRQAFGINILQKSFPLTFSFREDTEADEIEAFLEARNGTESFTWTPPLSVTPGLWICQEWDRQIKKAGRSTITATFEKVYDPS